MKSLNYTERLEKNLSSNDEVSKRKKLQKIEHCDERVRRERRFPSSLNTGLGQKLEFFKTKHNNAAQV